MKAVFKAIFEGLLRACGWLFLIIVLPIASCIAGYEFDAWQNKKEGKKVIAQIEGYKLQHGRLPASLTDIGIEEKMEEPIYYGVEDDNGYYVYFGTTLGESTTYHSNTRKWDDE